MELGRVGRWPRSMTCGCGIRYTHTVLSYTIEGVEVEAGIDCRGGGGCWSGAPVDATPRCEVFPPSPSERVLYPGELPTYSTLPHPTEGHGGCAMVRTDKVESVSIYLFTPGGADRNVTCEPEPELEPKQRASALCTACVLCFVKEWEGRGSIVRCPCLEQGMIRNSVNLCT